MKKNLLLSGLVILFGLGVILMWGGVQKLENSGIGSTRGTWSAPGSSVSERFARTGGTILIAFGFLGGIVLILNRQGSSS